MCFEKKIPDSKLGTIVLNQTAIQILERFSDFSCEKIRYLFYLKEISAATWYIIMLYLVL